MSGLPLSQKLIKDLILTGSMLSTLLIFRTFKEMLLYSQMPSVYQSGTQHMLECNFILIYIYFSLNITAYF